MALFYNLGKPDLFNDLGKSRSFNKDNIASSSPLNLSNDTNVCSSSQAKHGKRKRGVADERLEKARKSVLKISSKDESVTTINALAAVNNTEGRVGEFSL